MTDFSSITVAELLRLHSAIGSELRRREILRSSNGPAGDYGEVLFARGFGWTLVGKSASGHDAIDADGRKFQIKTRRITQENPSRQLSFMRKLPERPFDFLAGVLLDEHYRVVRAALMPIEVVAQEAAFVAHVNAWRLFLRDSIWRIPSVQDSTGALKRVEDTL